MKRKTKIICLALGMVAAIGGFAALVYCIVMEKIEQNQTYVIPILIFFIMTIIGLIFTVIIGNVKSENLTEVERRKNLEIYQNALKEKNNEYSEKENEGEFKVKAYLGKTKAGIRYTINDLIIANYNQTKSSQIDHILINTFGVWCIETKNWHGKIFGKETDENWTQVLNYGKEKYKHYNPIKQNNTHVYYLKKVLGNNTPIHSLIAFVDSDISEIQIQNVCDVKEIDNIIWRKNGINLSIEQMETYYYKILEIKETQISTEQHIKNIAI